MSSEIIHFWCITSIEEGSCNGISHRFYYRKANKITNKKGIHISNWPTFNNSVISAPLAKWEISRWWLGKITINIPQLVFARDIHLNNLWPQDIVGVILLNVDRHSRGLRGDGRGLRSVQCLSHPCCQFKDRIWEMGRVVRGVMIFGVCYKLHGKNNSVLGCNIRS